MPEFSLRIVRDETGNVGLDVAAEKLDWRVILPDDSELYGVCPNTAEGISRILHPGKDLRSCI